MSEPVLVYSSTNTCELCEEAPGTIPAYCDSDILLCEPCNKYHLGRFTCPFHGDDH